MGHGTLKIYPEKPSIKDVTPVTKDGMEVQVFNNMIFTISDGSAELLISTLNTYDDRVWPSSGTWTFQNNDKNNILRSDDISMSIFAEVIHNYAQPKKRCILSRTSFTTTEGTKDVGYLTLKDNVLPHLMKAVNKVIFFNINFGYILKF